VITSLFEAGITGRITTVTGGTYGISSKEFNPAMIKAC